MDMYIHFNTVCLYVQEESLSWEENGNVGGES